MNIWNNLKNFLYDKENFIALFQNKIYIYNFQKIITLTSQEIYLYLENKKLIIKGNNLKTIKCSKNELLLTGDIEVIKYE